MKRIRTYIYGLMGAIIICAPLLILYQYIPLADRGGSLSYNLLLPICFIALCGNFMEETLFRGYAQGYFEKYSSPIKAAVLSGILFAVGHIFLASTVTDLGMVLLGFTLYEGLICAFVRMKHGVLASTISHGMAIFILSSGLF
ncbi:membrane protease YdiL (CAAX protease family) [Paenibacillus anaericanus]|uniref:CPBP family intramembrane glutamic endopeptidase n=1 Tax=Paenibacillus anaericanus TaxID=170367 RepID=UPI00278A9408|nr:CPBP family intramembrane glutamic endopeptidase [Paenibacillus anaericanus]MDQ0087877.1 membrane protease YdiL (CAAX protease family) [Paenibacillus anaericanus]